MAGRSRLARIGVAIVILGSCAAEHDVEPGSTTRAVGVADDPILLGTTMPLTGPASLYRSVARAQTAYFSYVNLEKGGVNGREIIYIVEDDGYVPANTAAKTRKLVEDDQVFLMFSGLGGDPQLEVRTYLNEREVPQLFVAAGLTTFSADHDLYPFTRGWQPTLQVEGRIYALDILANHPGARIGVLYEDDPSGRDSLSGLRDGLGAEVSMIAAAVGIPPSATPLEVRARVAMLPADIDTLVVFAPPAHSIASLIGVRLQGWTPNIYLNAVSNLPLFMNLAGGAALQNVTTLGYLKDASDPTLELDEGMLLYRRILSTYCPPPACNVNDPLAVYGVASAYTMVDVLERAGANPTRSDVMRIVNRLSEQDDHANPFLLDGSWVKTTPSDPFPITRCRLMKWSGTRWIPQDVIIDGKPRGH
jgi:branched-chain amino acid transport system substrate-binding protein